MNRILLPALTAAAVALLPSAASAITLYGITTPDTNQQRGLYSFDSATPATVTLIGTLEADIVDIDFSPVNNQLYGMDGSGTLYSIDTGVAGIAFVGDGNPAITGGVTEIDFNPAADRLRVFAGNNNYRLSPDASAIDNVVNPPVPLGSTSDGPFTGLPAAVPNLVGSAYTNSFNGVPATTLYSVDAVSNSLIIHSGGPQFSTLASVGSLGIDIGTDVGFDIGQDGVAYLTNGNSLYTVDLTSGAAIPAGTVGVLNLASIAAAPVPEAGSAVLGLLSGALLLGRRRR